MDHALPRRLGNYEPLLELASGGMATVYVARQLGAAGFERVVVLKRVHRHLLKDRGFLEMFRDEARIASMVRHPNVVPVIDVVEAERELLLVMEYVESLSLSTLRKAAAEAGVLLPPAVSVKIVCDALAGLEAAHDAVDMRGRQLEVVHRDVSPQNIIVSVDGSSRLIDFGVAKAVDRLVETNSGAVKGKYGYMAPEQMRGEAVDRRSDVFAAAIVLWEVLTGVPLFTGENELDTMRRITSAPIPDPSTLNPAVPLALDPVLRRALQRDTGLRFQTAMALVDALEQAARPASPREVSATLQALGGPRLDERRRAITSRLQGAARTDESGELHDTQTASLTPPSMPSAGALTASLTPGSMPRQSVMPGGPEASRSTAGGSPAPTRHVGPWLLGSGAAAVALVTLGLVLSRPGSAVVATSSPPALPASATMLPAAPAPSASAEATPPVPTPPAPLARPALAADEIALELTADEPVESVRARGLRRVELDGRHARVVVQSWKGALRIEATLSGDQAGKPVTATTTASAGGKTSLALVSRRKHVTGRPPKELQSNPYGDPLSTTPGPGVVDTAARDRASSSWRGPPRRGHGRVERGLAGLRDRGEVHDVALPPDGGGRRLVAAANIHRVRLGDEDAQLAGRHLVDGGIREALPYLVEQHERRLAHAAEPEVRHLTALADRGLLDAARRARRAAVGSCRRGSR
jgi:eukaryotic-like serine/threonine-protein kinase